MKIPNWKDDYGLGLEIRPRVSGGGMILVCGRHEFTFDKKGEWDGHEFSVIDPNDSLPLMELLRNG